MGQTDVASVRNMVTKYGVQETINKLAKEGLSKEQINGLIQAVFAGKSSPAIDVVEFTIDVNGKKVGIKAPVGFDTELPMHDQAANFAQEGYYSIKTENDKLYGVFATGEVDYENPKADIRKEYAGALRAQAEKDLEKNKAWAEAQQQAALRLGAIGAAGMAGSILVAAVGPVIAEVLASRGVQAAAAETAKEFALAQAPRMALNGYLSKAAVVSLIAAALASCANDDPLVKVGGEERYDLGTTVNQNVNIPITLPVIDYTPYFNTLITQLNNLQNDQAKAFKLVIEGINALFQKTSATADDIEAILANLRKVVNNQEQQISITTKNHQDFQAFAAELMAILVKMKAIMQDTKLSVEEQTRQITELLDSLGISISNIESISSDTNQTVHDIYEKIDKLKGMFDDTAILEAIDKLAKKGDKANELLELIYEAMGSIGDKMKSYFGDLIKLAVQNNASLDDLKKLLKEINYNVQVNGEQAHDDAQAILEAIKKLGVDVSGDLAAILNAINSLPQSQQKDYTDALKAILDKINQGNVENNANFKAVLDAIKEHGAKVTVGMNKILEAIQNQPDYTAKLDAILKKLDALGAKAQEILEAIKDHDVKITVDVTGKVQCECNCSCGDGGKHEGIIGNLQDLLG